MVMATSPRAESRKTTMCLGTFKSFISGFSRRGSIRRHCTFSSVCRPSCIFFHGLYRLTIAGWRYLNPLAVPKALRVFLTRLPVSSGCIRPSSFVTHVIDFKSQNRKTVYPQAGLSVLMVALGRVSTWENCFKK